MGPNAESIWVIGYGQFGSRAADLLAGSSEPCPQITVVDSKPDPHIARHFRYIQADGVQWFIDNFQRTSTVRRVIPALPVHLAAQWLEGRLTAEGKCVSKLAVPTEILTLLPNPLRLSDDCYAISHADFLCPSDCNEPDQFCTMTCQPRSMPLYDLVRASSLERIVTMVIQSRQFAPGVGGFYPADLWELLNKVQEHGNTSFVVTTACKCHGIITGFKVKS